jgi:hypothetical protein
MQAAADFLKPRIVDVDRVTPLHAKVDMVTRWAMPCAAFCFRP